MKKILSRETFRGLYCILPTPFDKQGKISTEIFKKSLNILMQFNIDGIILAGTLGEFFSLEEREKVCMTEIAAEMLAPTNINLVAGGSAFSLEEQIKLGKLLRKAGAQALMNLVPTPPILSDDEYCDFWKRLADKVGDIGLMIYSLADMTHMPSAQVLVKVAKEVPLICGTKEGHKDFERWLYIHRNTDITVMPADDYQWIDYYKEGSKGFMTPSVSLCPPLACITHKGYLQQKWGETMQSQKAFMRLWDLIISDNLLDGFSGIARFKAVCRAMAWIDPGLSHPPVIDVPNEIQTELNRKIAVEFPDYCRMSNQFLNTASAEG